MERTEDQIVAGEPLRVTLGGKQYEIKPLKINAQYQWRKRFYAEFSKAAQPFLSKHKPGLLARLMGKDETDQFVEGLRVALLDVPERISDLFFAYAPYLPRAEIEETATEVELVRAFKEVVQLGFPFVEMLKTLMALAKLQPLAKPTNARSATGASPRTM